MGDDQGFRDVLGLELMDHSEGFARLAMEASEGHLNPGGTVHGGAIATLVDSSMGMAVATTTDHGERPVTIDLSVTYLEPATTGRLVCTAQVRKRGKRITVVEAEVTQDDEVVALGSGTFTTVG